MNINYLKKVFGISLVALTFVFAAAGVSNAQQDRDHNNNGHKQNGYRMAHGNYRTDQQGVELLRQAVNQGYSQGFQAGQQDHSNRHRGNNWRQNESYRNGDMGYDSHVDRTQYRYYFQQGFQKGYDDGYNSRSRYGSNNNVLDTILNLIVKPRPY